MLTDKELHKVLYGKCNGIFRACANNVYQASPRGGGGGGGPGNEATQCLCQCFISVVLIRALSDRLSKPIFAMTLPFCLAKSALWFLLLWVLSLNWIHSKINSGATFHIIVLAKISKIEFLPLDWIYRSIRIITVISCKLSTCALHSFFTH